MKDLNTEGVPLYFRCKIRTYMKNSIRLSLRDRIVVVFASVMGALPAGWVSAIGAAIGELVVRHAIRSHAADKSSYPGVARFNKSMEKLKGIASAEALKELLIEYGCQTGRLYAEFVVLHKIDKQGHITIEGKENLGGLNKPVIFIAPHMSNFELAGKALTLMDNPGCALIDPIEGEGLARIVNRARLAWRKDFSLISSDSPMVMKYLTKKLSDGDNLLIFSDELRKDYVWAPSLGRKIPYGGNRWLVARLAVRHNVDVIPLCVQRFNAIDFKILIGNKIPVPPDGNKDSKAKYIADQIDHVFDSWVRNRLEHWYLIRYLDLDKRMPDRFAS